ncbi:MAG TPA: hypothetical protein VG455_03020 [Acidimicrobiales bacterium]|nr:hypothetical protein [Acidimicrobiales bacterium]
MAVNLALVIAFALFAVIQLSRVALAAKQIKQRVKTITTEVGPGSNVSRLDEVAILDTVAARADQILAAAKPLSGQANDVLIAARSIDATGSRILENAQQINGTVRSINGTFQSLAPVVNNIRGRPGTIDNPAPADVGGVEAINIRVDNALRNIAGIRADLNGTLANVVSINAHAGDISAFATNPLADPIGLVSGVTCSALGLLCTP